MLAAKGLHYVSQLLNIDKSWLHAWSDSAIFLAWIQKPPGVLKFYVGSRISQLLELTSPSIWKHVPLRVNPADIASRGLYPEQLVDSTLWLSGPNWLNLPSYQWPLQIINSPASCCYAFCPSGSLHFKVFNLPDSSRNIYLDLPFF